ncbi:MAG: hypothetical protein ACLQDY_13540 [Streptosporangiaceae bacterium]
MQFFGWQSLRRNWLVAVTGLFVTICLTAAAFVMVPASYVATDQIALIPPIPKPTTANGGTINPYLGLAGLDSMAAVVALAMTDEATGQALAKAGVSQYTVEPNPLSAGPILILQVQASTPAAASNALDALTRQAPLTVARLQREASIASSAFVTVQVISRPSLPARSGKTQLRAVILVFILGIVLTLLAVAFVDAWRIRRRQRGFPGRGSYDQGDLRSADTGQEFPESNGTARMARGAGAFPDMGHDNETLIREPIIKDVRKTPK